MKIHLNLIKNSEDSKKPWEQIPDVLWHQEALKMWWEGYPVKDIAPKVSTPEHPVTTDTIYNVFSKLRQSKYKKYVPTEKERKKFIFQQKRDIV